MKDTDGFLIGMVSYALIQIAIFFDILKHHESQGKETNL